MRVGKWLAARRDRKRRKDDDGRPLDIGPETPDQVTEDELALETADDTSDDLTELSNPEHANASKVEEEAMRRLGEPFDPREAP